MFSRHLSFAQEGETAPAMSAEESQVLLHIDEIERSLRRYENRVVPPVWTAVELQAVEDFFVQVTGQSYWNFYLARRELKGAEIEYHSAREKRVHAENIVAQMTTELSSLQAEVSAGGADTTKIAGIAKIKLADMLASTLSLESGLLKRQLRLLGNPAAAEELKTTVRALKERVLTSLPLSFFKERPTTAYNYGQGGNYIAFPISAVGTNLMFYVLSSKDGEKFSLLLANTELAPLEFKMPEFFLSRNELDLLRQDYLVQELERRKVELEDLKRAEEVVRENCELKRKGYDERIVALHQVKDRLEYVVHLSRIIESGEEDFVRDFPYAHYNSPEVLPELETGYGLLKSFLVLRERNMAGELSEGIYDHYMSWFQETLGYSFNDLFLLSEESRQAAQALRKAEGNEINLLVERKNFGVISDESAADAQQLGTAILKKMLFRAYPSESDAVSLDTDFADTDFRLHKPMYQMTRTEGLELNNQGRFAFQLLARSTSSYGGFKLVFFDPASSQWKLAFKVPRSLVWSLRVPTLLKDLKAARQSKAAYVSDFEEKRGALEARLAELDAERIADLRHSLNFTLNINSHEGTSADHCRDALTPK